MGMHGRQSIRQSIRSDDDMQSVYSGYSGTSSWTGMSQSAHSSEQMKVAEEEQKAVRLSKALVIVVLLISLVTLASTTMYLLSKYEEEDFKTQFNNYASEITAVSKENVKNAFGTIEAFSSTVTSIAKQNQQEWPFVTINDFEALGNRVRDLTGAFFVILAPLVSDEQRPAFEKYNMLHTRDNLQRAIDYSGDNKTVDDLGPLSETVVKMNFTSRQKYPHSGPGPYIINWHRAPYFPNFVMMDMYSQKTIRDAYLTSNITKRPTMNFAFTVRGVFSQVIQPVFETVPAKGELGEKIVAVLRVSIEWGTYFTNLLTDEAARGIIVVMEDVCGFNTTYMINGTEAIELGMGDHHDPKYDDMGVTTEFLNFDYDEDVQLPSEYCLPHLTLRIFPSDQLREEFRTNEAVLYTVAVVFIFLFTSFVFIIYDITVGRRQRIVMERIIRQDKIVSNLFPSMIKDRLYGVSDGVPQSLSVPQWSSKSYLDSNDVENPYMLEERPIADLYLKITVMFADIVGFTAWSSAREPAHVFMLLEGIYGGFDKLANRLNVFKVETVGDCYVAASGLPEPCEDHAVVMAKFARACMHKFSIITQKLEVALGPDTGELELRVGLHSGQVTGGVLRGERSRFQLFGDTMNTAARVESTSMKNKIQVSSVTAELLRGLGREKWLTPREERITVAGKGHMQMYWLTSKSRESKKTDKPELAKIEESAECFTMESDKDTVQETVLDHSTCSTSSSMDLFEGNVSLSKLERLTEWTVDVMGQLLVQVVATREGNKNQQLDGVEQSLGSGTTVLEEFQEIITLKKIGVADIQKWKDPSSIVLGDEVISQLRNFVARVASTYRENAFHNFEHATHVTASVRKLLTRIVSIDNMSSDMEVEDLLGHSYGITSDPLTQFAVIFSAIIHDMDHPGVPNTQLVKEQVPIAAKYKEKSVAEQNSVDLAWEMLMDAQYKDLRDCIYSTEDELRRFRQLVVNVVMATDICDKELQTLRKQRWNHAFSEDAPSKDKDLDVNRKATIVIEHLIQASDVSHTMQHWKIYLKWNERFFMEMYGAYRNGRAESDPSTGWYKGEIGFFDFYIIPLAKKLENCGVFGVSSEEYLNYALANRDEWVREGEAVVKGYLEKYEMLHGEQ